MATNPTRTFLKLFKESVDEGLISKNVSMMQRRILMIKKQSGLFERPFSDQSLLSYIGSQNHREIAREAVQKSMVFKK